MFACVKYIFTVRAGLCAKSFRTKDLFAKYSGIRTYRRKEAQTGQPGERESLDSVQNLDVKELAGERNPGRHGVHTEL
jgi:hypothetical protein